MRLLKRRFAAVACAAVLAAGCVSLPREPVTGAPLEWSQLPGWSDEQPAGAWAALVLNCQKMSRRVPAWTTICADAQLFPAPDNDIARAFFETRFEAIPIGNGGGSEGLVTGYYEPLLHGSVERTARYRYPVYGRPDDLVIVDLGELYPELRDRRLRGRIHGKRVVPYHSRAEINGKGTLNAPVLLWVDDAVALFFLQIQGSGRVLMEDGRVIRVGYADQNGHPYHAIGRYLIDIGALEPQHVSLQSIRAWLKANPPRADEVMNANPSYVFFEVRGGPPTSAIGSLGLPLVPERAVAIDPEYVPLGSLLYLDTHLPAVGEPFGNNNGKGNAYRRLVFAHDTGGAIKGAVRADLFFGFGPRAELLAGHMKQAGRLYLLRPRAR